MFFSRNKIANFVEGKIAKVSQRAVDNLSSNNTTLYLPTGYDYSKVDDFKSHPIEFVNPIKTEYVKGVKKTSLATGIRTQLKDNIILPAKSVYIKGVHIGANTTVGINSRLNEVVLGVGCIISNDCEIVSSHVEGSVSIESNVAIKNNCIFMGNVTAEYGTTISGVNSFDGEVVLGEHTTIDKGAVFSKAIKIGAESSISGVTFVDKCLIGSHGTISGVLFKGEAVIGPQCVVKSNTIFSQSADLKNIKLKKGVTFCSSDNCFDNCDISGAINLPENSVLKGGTLYNRFVKGSKSKVFGYIGEGADINNANINKATIAKGAYISNSIISYSKLDSITIDSSSKPSVFNNVTFSNSNNEVTMLEGALLRGQNKAFCDIEIDNDKGVIDLKSIPLPGLNNVVEIHGGTIKAEGRVELPAFDGVIEFNGCEFVGVAVSSILKHEGFVVEGLSEEVVNQKENTIVILPSGDPSIEDVMDINNDLTNSQNNKPVQSNEFDPNNYSSLIENGVPGYLDESSVGYEINYNDLIPADNPIPSKVVVAPSNKAEFDNLDREIKNKVEPKPGNQPVNEIELAGM